MGTEWTKTFGDMIEKQKPSGRNICQLCKEQKRLPFSGRDFFCKVRECQSRWSSEELLEISPVKYKIGTKEGEDVPDMFRK